MGQQQLVKLAAFRVGLAGDQFDLGAEVVPVRQVEAQRAPAAPAIVAVALAQRGDALALLFAADRPRKIFGEDGVAVHRQVVTRDWFPSG